jgi:hypothetical protein
MRLYAEMTDAELDAIDLVEFTKLNVGDRVTHVNAGKHGGNGTTISSQTGTITGHQNQGLQHWGGLCVTVSVQWDDGSQYEMVYSLAKKVV